MLKEENDAKYKFIDLNIKDYPFNRQTKGKNYTLINNLFYCTYDSSCKKFFNREQKIKKHLKSHIFKKKILCKFEGCNKKFSSVNNLKVTKLSLFLNFLNTFINLYYIIILPLYYFPLIL